jgi:AraC-like DNA-binding protein
MDVSDSHLKIERRCASPQHSDMSGSKPDKAARLLAILHVIESRSGEADLSAAVVAQRLGVTPRYVHLLLERTGKSFSHHLLEARLQKAATLLCDPQWHERRIGDIAAEVGFTDLSHFSRTFRRRYGSTPSEMRAASRGDD